MVGSRRPACDYDIVARSRGISQRKKKTLASGAPEIFEEKMWVGEELRTYASIKFPRPLRCHLLPGNLASDVILPK
jgi:hypothetical protein